MTTTVADDHTVMTLVDEALARPESERQAFVWRNCAGDRDLFQEVWRRVELELRMGPFLLEPLVPRSELRHPFQPGQLLNDRFRIVREIGHGGMGIVYEAIDERLENKRIAIKCAQPGFQRRLSPEAITSTEIKHRNVCRVFEIHRAATSLGDVEFLTMEYLEGETLAQRLARAGPLATNDACEIVRQLCEGLEEAHHRVIHGDLKPANIILTKTLPGVEVPVITDFGLARRVGGPVPSPLVAAASGGTPAYMAPELWDGGKPSIFSDIYALGVMFYEMLTGHLPPRQNAADLRGCRYDLKLARKELAGAGYLLKHLLVRCLDFDAARRPARAITISKTIAIRKNIVRSLRYAGATAVVLLAGPAILYRPDAEVIHLAVLPLDAAPQQKSLADLASRKTAELLRRAEHQHRRFSVIPVAASRNLKTAEQACNEAHATHVLTGQLRQESQQVAVTARVLSACSEETLNALTLQYATAEMDRLPAALAAIVTRALHLPPITQDAQVQNADYVAGLNHLRNESEVDDAVRLLSRAAGSESRSPAVWAELAEAYRLKFKITNDGEYRALAIKTLARAESLNPDSAPVCRVEGLLHLDAGLYAQALDDFKRAVELDPKHPAAYLGLARAYKKMDRLREAFESVGQAIEIAPRYAKAYQQLGGFYYDLGQYEKSASALTKVVDLTPDVPDAHVNLASPYAKLGRYAEAERELRIALRLRETLDAHLNLGAVLDYQGRFSEAIPNYRRAVQMSPNDYLSWINLGDDYRRTGQAAKASQAYQRALEVTRQEVSENPQDGNVRAFVAYLLARLDDREQAEYEMSQALQLPPADAQVFRTAVLTYVALGERAQAISLLRKAPSSVIDDLRRQPDMADFCRDPRFEALTNHGTQ